MGTLTDDWVHSPDLRGCGPMGDGEPVGWAHQNCIPTSVVRNEIENEQVQSRILNLIGNNPLDLVVHCYQHNVSAQISPLNNYIPRIQYRSGSG